MPLHDEQLIVPAVEDKWIPSRGVNGEYGWLNTKTGQFTTTDPTSGQRLPVEQSTSVKRPSTLLTRNMGDVAADRAIRNRETKRKDPGYDEKKDRLYTEIAKALSSDFIADMAGGAADGIDHAMGASFFIPGYGTLLGTAYFGAKGAKDLANGNYLQGGLEVLPIAGSGVAGAAKMIWNSPSAEYAKFLYRLRYGKPNMSYQVPNNVGWAPAQTVNVIHASDSFGPLTLFKTNRWDVVNEGANPHGVWLQGKIGIPRTETTNPGKGIKAERARLLFASRPNQIQGLVIYEKPMQTVGDVNDRSALSWFADLLGADGIIYNGVYDNGYNANLVIHSFKLPRATLNSPSINNASESVSLAFLQRPTKLTLAERLGIPKGERHNLNKYQLDALSDLELFIKSGQYRQFSILNKNGGISWTTKDNSELSNIINNANSVLAYGKNGTAASWSGNDNFFTLKWDPETFRRMVDVSSKGEEAIVGETSTMPISGYTKIFITAPKASGGESATVSKDLMRNWWRDLQESTAPGTYISGDEIDFPLGKNLIDTFKRFSVASRKDNSGNVIGVQRVGFDDIRKALLNKNMTKSAHNDQGLSTDSYLSILKLAAREGSPYLLRYSTTGITKFNNQSFENKHISDLLERANNGEIPKLLFVEEFNKWVSPYKGQPAEILQNGEIFIPQPFLYRMKFGGKLCSRL